MSVFGTRPEIIKLAPVIKSLSGNQLMTVVNVSTAQHTDLLAPFMRSFGVAADYDLQAMCAGQTPDELCARVLAKLAPIIAAEQPDLVLVQGDTTSALAGALAAFYQGCPVGHVEAGLRSGNPLSPFPEEMNRRLITRLATYHFAPTAENRFNLLSEGVADDMIFVTGNPVVDALEDILAELKPSEHIAELLARTAGLKRVVLTTHRRESFGAALRANLLALRDFARRYEDVAVLFPVHPNPNVRAAAQEILADEARIILLAPLDYADFIALLSAAWLTVSDSGGVQEEAPTLGVPLLVLRENTERPEAITAGCAELVGSSADKLRRRLEDVYRKGWQTPLRKVNPFGDGNSAARIAGIIGSMFQVPSSKPETNQRLSV